VRIKIHQFLFKKSHSWAVVGKNMARAFLKHGHEVHLFSTDGLEKEFIEDDLAPHIRIVKDSEYNKLINPSLKSKFTKTLESNYDLQFSYTAMRNFPPYLSAHYGGYRTGMWTYEWDVLPNGFAKYANAIDKFAVPTHWFKDVCVKNGIPATQMEVVPHGVDWDKYENAEPMQLNTDKKIKILCNFAQPHIRKNIPGTLEAFGRAFTKKDDVCFVLKVVDKKPDKPFEISFRDALAKFKKKYKDHAEIKVINHYLPSMAGLYKACDIFFLLSFAEGFFLPLLQSLAAGKVVIVPNHGAQLDFLNKDNAVLVGGKVVRADRKSLYWSSTAYASCFKTDLDEAAEKLRYVAENYQEVQSKIKFPDEEFRNRFSWDNAAAILEGLAQNDKH